MPDPQEKEIMAITSFFNIQYNHFMERKSLENNTLIVAALRQAMSLQKMLAELLPEAEVERLCQQWNPELELDNWKQQRREASRATATPMQENQVQIPRFFNNNPPTPQNYQEARNPSRHGPYVKNQNSTARGHQTYR